MRTIGEIIKQARIEKNITFEKLEDLTKIKREFIKAIESEKWANLPEYPVVQGFIKNLAKTLEVGEEKATALLRRDYPPKTLPVNPKPDVQKNFFWSPKLTFFLSGGLLVILILGYLFFQYYNYVKPPKLQLAVPVEGEIVEAETVLVQGETNADATVTVNNQPVVVEKDGSFLVNLEVSQNTEKIIVVAESSSGKKTELSRTINFKL